MASKMSLKLLINKSSHKVLLAEASKEVVDFIFSLLGIPVGTIIKLLTKECMAGSIANIYRSVERLNDIYFQTTQDKNLLLDPTVLLPSNSHPTLLLPKPSATKWYYSCYYCDFDNSPRYFTDTIGMSCPLCKRLMTEEMHVNFTSKKIEANCRRSGDGFVNGIVTYTIMDDLTITPTSTINSIMLLNNFNIKDLGSLQERTVKLGLEEGLGLLKASLQSETVLTDVFLQKK